MPCPCRARTCGDDEGATYDRARYSEHRGNLPDFDLASWHALIGLKGLTPAVVERVNREINRTLRSPDVSDRMQADGVTPSGSTPEELRARIQREIPMWKGVVARAKIKLE